jgi:hypothetical protein
MGVRTAQKEDEPVAEAREHEIDKDVRDLFAMLGDRYPVDGVFEGNRGV